ncbi:MAG TPA: SusC/RagA family TonB-linked outer membrane protein, partial [Chryseolinea sp.]|nr:SusC/RagA family TonB-linked outer membrane protein [Chryseolinea sp.]
MKRILLVCLTAVVMLTSSELWAQERTVSGKVTSTEDGSGLPGVNVVVKGTTNGTVTDLDGNYTLSVSSTGQYLVFTFIGLKSEEVEIGGRSTVDISLALDVTQLSEVVVTAFGVEQQKKALGYSVQEVKGDQFTQARDQNIVSSLSGKIAGAQITTTSGGVGSSSRIVLRGASSLTGNNQPLFVVDGIPISNRATGNSGSGGGTDFGNGAADINPDDVETVTVLSPNAAALYGSRASNGVILITTKSGKGTKGLGVSVNISTQFDNPMRLPDFQNSYGQGASDTFFQYVDGSNGDEGVDESWGMPLDIGLEAVQWNSNQQAAPWVSQPDNLKDYLETGVLATQNVALSGGSDKGHFRLSFTNLSQTGTLPNTDLKRKTVSISSGLNLTKKLSADFSANYVNGHSDNRPVTGYTGQNPIQQFIWSGRNVDFAALKDYQNLPLATTGLGAGYSPINWNDRFQNNPYWAADNNINGNQRDRIYGNIKANYKVTDWLSFFVRTGLDYYTEGQTRIRAKGIESTTEGNGFFQEYTETRMESNTDFLITARKELGTDVVVSISGGGNRRDERFTQLIGTAPQLELPGVYNLSNVKSGVALTVTNFSSQKRVNSFYGTASFAYKNYLFVDFNGRNDWSSTLPDGENSYFYPGVSASATLSDIFNIQSSTLSYLKIRGAWAQVGSDTDPYRLQQTFQFRSPWGTVLSPNENNSLLNPQLKPEQTTSTEIGVESSFWSGRLNAAITVYNKTTNDQIIPVQISGASGYTTRNTNIGEMVNKGLEIQLSGSPVKMANGFEWNIVLNWARNISEVTELAPGVDALNLGGQWNVTTQARIGEAYGSLFGPGFVRDPKGNIVHGENGLPVIDETYKVLGNFTPKWTGGLTNTFTYKGITLDVLIDGRYGGDIYSMTTSWGRYSGVLEETLLGRETGIVGKGVIDNGDGTFRPNDVVVTAEQYNKGAYSNDVAESSIFDG